MKKYLIAAAALMAGTAALAQVAQVAPPAPPAPIAHPMTDKVMTRAEAVGMVRDRFGRMDANKDGSISRDEFGKAHEERIERRVEIREKRREGAKDGKEAGQSMRKHRMGGFGGRMIVMADTNKDGRITLAEAETMALQHFDQMDTNRDGQVTREERRAGRPMIIKKVIEEKTTSG